MASKLGFHIQRRRQGWPNVIADTVPAVVKSLEWGIMDEWLPDEQTDPAKVQRAKKWTEYDVFLLGRHPTTEQHLDNPIVRADAFWARILHELSGGEASRQRQVLDRMRCFDAWEGYNEVGTGPDIGNLGRFDARMAWRFHEEGMRYACGGFSMTQPTLEEWPLYCEALLDKAASATGALPDFLHLHEYWFPRQGWDELLTSDGGIDDEAMRAATRGYMLHWRELYTHPDTPPEMRRPLIISECGWDKAWPEQVGYRKSSRSDEDYVKWLCWYDRELQKPLDGVDYVVGATIYTYGHQWRWASFEIDYEHGRGILDPLRAYLRESNMEPHPRDWEAAWNPQPAPEPEPVEPTSHYVLLAQNCPDAWRRALEGYFDVYKVTNGQSLDDALRLATAHHHITLVGDADCDYGVPLEWEDEIRRRAPEVTLDRIAGGSAEQIEAVVHDRVVRGDRYGNDEGDVDSERDTPPIRPRGAS